MLAKSQKHIPQAIYEISQLISSGFESKGAIEATCQLIFTADSGQNFPLKISIANGRIHVTEAAASNADAGIIMSLECATTIARGKEFIDFRDPTIMGDIEFSGDRELINLIAKSLVRPSEDARSRMQFASSRDTAAYQLKQIGTVHAPSEIEILARIERGEPFIATGLTLPEPCAEWSLERLASQYGDVPLRVRSANERENVAEFVSRLKKLETQAHDGPLIEGATKAYTEGCLLPEAMRSDFLPLRFCRDDYTEPQIWLGSVPTETPASSLHRDPLDGFLYQIMGRKRLILISPDQEDCVYPMKAWNNYQPCWVKPEAPDFNLYPKFANARMIEVALNPGELLVQPAGWFHAVYCLDSPTFSVSYFLKH
jgi:hypothetical protein